jgi:hypothetical protein
LNSRFPSTKLLKQDFNDFIPLEFKSKFKDTSSNEDSSENKLINELEEEEKDDFYTMVRSIFNSANINLKDEVLYSPLLEALIKNYSLALNQVPKEPIKQESNNSTPFLKHTTFTKDLSIGSSSKNLRITPLSGR